MSALVSKVPSKGHSIRPTGFVTWAVLWTACEFRFRAARNSDRSSPVRRKANAGPEGPASSLRPTGFEWQCEALPLTLRMPQAMLRRGVAASLGSSADKLLRNSGPALATLRIIGARRIAHELRAAPAEPLGSSSGADGSRTPGWKPRRDTSDGMLVSLRFSIRPIRTAGLHAGL